DELREPKDLLLPPGLVVLDLVLDDEGMRVDLHRARLRMKPNHDLPRVLPLREPRGTTTARVTQKPIEQTHVVTSFFVVVSFFVPASPFVSSIIRQRLANGGNFFRDHAERRAPRAPRVDESLDRPQN